MTSTPATIVLRSATFGAVRSISQRELRNDNAEIIRAVEAGESFTVTRRGVPVARLTPVPASDLRRIRAAAPGWDVTSLPRVSASQPLAEHLEDLRGDR
jgi:prevent-host-death family protein